MAAATIFSPTVTTSERMTFTLFVSVVIHLVIILGVGFNALKRHGTPPTLEITLAQHVDLSRPESADFLAQQNQKASGSLEVKRQLTTDSLAEFSDTQINHVDPLPRLQTTTQTPQEQKQLVSTIRPQQNNSTTKKLDLNPQESVAIQGEQKTLAELTAEISSLQAKLDIQRQQFAKKPRIRTLTSVAAKYSVDAEYLYHWQEKIEMIGNINYPEEARRKKLYGDLRLLVTLLPNGSVIKIELLKSSGSVVLDQAGIQIVRMASPFPPFSDELRKEVDRLEIIRTWRFEKGDILSTSSN